MTVVVGLVAGGRVLIGADAAGVSGYELTVRRDPKAFLLPGGYPAGFTTSFRMGQLVRYAFVPPRRPADLDGDDLHHWMCTDFVDALRETLKSGGWASNRDDREEGGTLLVGAAGRLFRIEDDYQVGESINGYDAVGCGADVALGSLYTTSALAAYAEAPAERVRIAMAAAEQHSGGVRGPFTVVESRALPGALPGAFPGAAEADRPADPP